MKLSFFQCPGLLRPAPLCVTQAHAHLDILSMCYQRTEKGFYIIWSLEMKINQKEHSSEDIWEHCVYSSLPGWNFLIWSSCMPFHSLVAFCHYWFLTLDMLKAFIDWVNTDSMPNLLPMILLAELLRRHLSCFVCYIISGCLKIQVLSTLCVYVCLAYIFSSSTSDRSKGLADRKSVLSAACQCLELHPTWTGCSVGVCPSWS